MRKISLVLVISASFIAGTLVTGNFVFADPADGQNNLLQMMLNKLNGTLDEAIFVHGEMNVQSYTCPNLDEIETHSESLRFDFSERSGNVYDTGLAIRNPLGTLDVGGLFGNF